MPIIYIDKKPYEVKPGKNLLEACLSLGFNLPYFCWHPAMGSVGACRQCAVKVFKDENDTKGKLMMSCMEGVRDNLHLSIDDPFAKAFRSQIIEWLMTNHPHDCAVCDEGGSCHLQDMTVMTGHNYRRFRYKKRTYKNQYLGPFLNHEMNRCIQCYRCVRFYKDYAGGDDLNVFAAHDHVYFGREKDGVLQNEFSGNLAEVCPTGVFTDKTLKEHYTRKWDFTMAPSICTHCSLGCNTIAGERYGELRQITSRYNGEVNAYFICDRGRFGYEFVNDINRIKHTLIRRHVPDVVDSATLSSRLREILAYSNRIIGVGSPRASIESNFALRQLVGKESFYQGVTEKEARLLKLVLKAYRSGRIHVPSLKETEEADVVFILGEDVTNTAPRLALSLRQAVRNAPLAETKKINIPDWHDAARRELIQEQKGDLFIAHPFETKTDELASVVCRLAPDDIARLGYAVAHLLDPMSAEPEDLDDEMRKIAQGIAGSLQLAKRPLIISGTGLFNESIIKAAFNIASALSDDNRKTDFLAAVPDCNSIGLAMTGAESFEQIGKNGDDTLIVLENDLYRRKPKEDLDILFSDFNNVIVLDHLHNATTARADILLPAATFAEGDGILINNEGRAQRFFQVYKPKNENIKESWRHLDEAGLLKDQRYGRAKNYDELLASLVKEMPQFAGVETVAPPADYRIAGQRIPREPHRYSGRTAMQANIQISEPKPPDDPDSPLSFTMEGYRGLPPGQAVPYFWWPGWNSVQAINKYQIEVGGPLHGGDPGRRLFDSVSDLEIEYLNPIPKAFAPRLDEWLLLPMYHIFGSEEFSLYTPGITQLSPEPYLALNTDDARVLGIGEGQKVSLQVEKTTFSLPIRIKEELPSGCAGIPFTVSPLVGIAWPARGKIITGV